MSVLIDPYMFELSDEREIRNNISFFTKVIKIASHSGKNEQVSFAIYQGMIERMEKRIIRPFPIDMNKIQDKELKGLILQINNSFKNILLQFIESIDIDECEGNQEFQVKNDEELVEDDNYYELLNVLLIPCYSKIIDIDWRIITGYKTKGKSIGDTFEISCDCENHKYSKLCKFVSVDEIIPIKDKAIDELKKKKRNGEISCVNFVIATMGSHHNHIQANGKKFECLEDLSAQNKVVLRLLKELGLFKIIFGEFSPKGIKGVGTMSIQSVESKEIQDIVAVKFSAETKMVIDTFLYFPKGVGKLLQKYFQAELLNYKNVSELVEKIK